MSTLRDALLAAGLTDVRSYLQTGNLTLEAGEAEAGEAEADVVAGTVESVMATLGLRAPCAVVRTWPDFVALAAERPFDAWSVDHHALTVSFCRSAIPDPIREPWLERGLTFVGGTPWAMFAATPRDLVRAPSANALIERRWGIPASTRYWHVLTDWVERESTVG